MIKSYRMKPVIKEAIQISQENLDEIMDWLNKEDCYFSFNTGMGGELLSITVETDHGDMMGDPSDWIVRGLEGEFYPVQDSKFQATYEEIE